MPEHHHRPKRPPPLHDLPQRRPHGAPARSRPTPEPLTAAERSKIISRRGLRIPAAPALRTDLSAMMLCLDRKNAKAQWLVYNGRYGTPPVFAIMPKGVDESLRKEYIKFAMQCVSNAAGVLPAGADVKTVTPGNGGPDTFSRMIDLSTQELVLRATGGLMTMLTAPGAGTNTATGSAHQDAFDDLAASEAEQIANLLQEKLFAPVLEQWHPGQPHLVEFVMRRPDSDNAAGSVANIATLAQNGYRTPDEQVAELTGLQVATDTLHMQQPGMAMPPALNSLRVRYAPTMLYPPARAAFERAINMAAQPSGSAAELRRDAAEEQPLTGGELAALAPLEAGQLSPDGISSRAATAYAVLRKAVRPAYSGEEEVAENGRCNQHGHAPDCTGANQAKHKGGRGSKGNPKNPTTQSNTPLKAAPGANTQAQVDATEHALRATEKKGKVMGAAHIDGKPVNIEAGQPDYHGTRHYKKHNKANDTSPRKAARAIGAGKTEPEPGEPDKIRRRHGETNASLAEKKGGSYRFITAHKKK